MQANAMQVSAITGSERGSTTWIKQTVYRNTDIDLKYRHRPMTG